MSKSDIIIFTVYIRAESYRNLDMSIYISRFRQLYPYMQE